MIKQIKTFIGEKVLAVEKLKDQSIKTMRYAKCKSCPFYDAKKDTCISCGCLMKVKAGMFRHRNPKAFGRVERTHCPNGLWNDKDLANKYRKLDNLELIQ